MDNIIDMMTKLPYEKVMQISSRFERIIESQIHLLLQRGVPAEKIIEIVNKIDGQMKDTIQAKKASGE